MTGHRPPPPLKRSFGAIAGQIAAAVIVVLILAWAGHNASLTLAERNMQVDFRFLANPAGFDIPFRVVP